MAWNKDDVPGFFGWAPQGKRVLAETAGFFGWSAGRATNLLLSFVPPPGALTIRQPLTITISYGGNSLLIYYNPDFPRLERQLPVNTPITISTSSTYYTATSSTVLINTNQVLNQVVQLAFAEQPVAQITRRRFL